VDEAADRLERCARILREMEFSDRTQGIIELQAMVISQTLTTSPDDAADFAELVARLMRS
jgi:hypothetical protein